VLQVSLSLALVCTSTLLGRSLWNVLSTDPGFDARGHKTSPRRDRQRNARARLTCASRLDPAVTFRRE
jgi:hypothetical protein